MSHPAGKLRGARGHGLMQLRTVQAGHGSKLSAAPDSSSSASSKSATRNAIHGPYSGWTTTPRMLGPARPLIRASSMKLSVALPDINGSTGVHWTPDDLAADTM